MREPINTRRLDEMECRAEMAESVNLPVDDFLQLIAAARNGLRPITATSVCEVSDE